MKRFLSNRFFIRGRMIQTIQVWVEHKMPKIEALTYQCHFHVEKGMRVLVPLQQRQVVGLVCDLNATSPEGITLKHVIKVLDDKPVFSDEQFELLDEVVQQTMSDPITVAKTMLPTLLKPKTLSASIIYEDWIRLNDTTDGNLTKRQAEIIHTLETQGQMSYHAYRQIAKSLSLKLIELGYVERFKKEKSYQRNRLPATEGFKQLTHDQQTAYQSIDLNSHRTYLLYGTTGSGKTEVYMHVVRDCISQGKSVFVLVPEVALTPQMIQRFESRFEVPIIVYHSNLSDNQRYFEYQSALDLQPKIIIGTRSSIFLPLSSIGCILMDEEHDLSFKQDVSPYYHARDIALFKAKKQTAP
jgi:primosomal protein N' (replication factor Y) (superfamily II helicase)